jgi:exopolysaccharide biosynthesis protein
MTKKTALFWLIPLILLLALIPFLVPSALPTAGAEEEETVPVLEPVTLANPSPDTFLDENGEALYSPHPAGVVSDPPGYQDSTISVRTEERTLKNGKGKKTKVLFTWVQIADPAQLRTALAGRYPSQSEKRAPQFAAEKKAVVAINGDWCVEPMRSGVGFVYRNGVKYREKPYHDRYGYDALIIDNNGDFHILRDPEVSELEPYRDQIMHAFVFGPALVVDGVMQEIPDNKYGGGGGMGLHKTNQRQVICQLDHLSYLIISTEGPEQVQDGGFTGQEIARIAWEAGAQNAYNLDGGSSTWVLIAQGENAAPARINNLKSPNQRRLTDIIYFVTAEPDPQPEPAEETAAAPEA